MKDITVRQLEMANRVSGFLKANPIVFRKSSPGADLVEQFHRQAAVIQGLTEKQVLEIARARACSRARGAARESLNAAMEKITRTAHGMALSVPGVSATFEANQGGGDAKLQTRARSLAESVKPFVKEFVNFELDPGFVGALEAKIETFVEAVANHKASRAAHVATSQMIDTAMEHALEILEQLSPIVENKLDGNMALTLKWENVRKVERRWVYKTPEEKTPVAPAA
jgi:hypothetical protein